ncbi:ganglioside-induced differentiation-associated protein 1-like [Amphiura filiformis]|uniref:ganglioside-induced differentiation-associated protein 1-like n=1 Tax=Amphiura filiformis TaxID=82378 RepID=UPI003B2198F5
MALTLYHFPPSFYSQRAFMALEEKDVSYHRHDVNVQSGEGIEPWYMRIQPNGTVPALKHGEIMKTDSKDIIQYLDEIAPDAPKFYPDASTPGGDRVAYLTDLMQNIPIYLITFGSACYRHHTNDCTMPKTINLESSKSMVDKRDLQIRKLADENPDLRERYLSKLKVGAKTSMVDKRDLQIRKLADENPDLRERYLSKLKVPKNTDLTDEDAFIASLEECDSILSEIENELAQKWKGKLDNFTDSDPWLCCDHFTIADIYLATLLHRLVLAGQVKRMWGDGKRPYLAAYYARVQQRKSFQSACGSANNWHNWF